MLAIIENVSFCVTSMQCFVPVRTPQLCTKKRIACEGMNYLFDNEDISEGVQTAIIQINIGRSNRPPIQMKLLLLVELKEIGTPVFCDGLVVYCKTDTLMASVNIN